MSKDSPIHTPGQPPPSLVAALRKLLRPLVRLLVSHQITYPYLINLLKSVYVEVAEEEFTVADKRQSDSRITLLTGVHRKDVKRLRSEDPAAELEMPRSISIGAQIIAYWLGAEPFSRDGTPLPLPLRTALRPDTAPPADTEVYFDDLVERVCRQDIRPRVILDEWVRLGVAHLDEKQRVVLNTGAFTPDKGFEEKVFFFGKNIHDHISAGTHNLLGGHPPHFDRSVYYDQLSETSVRTLQELAGELGMQALVAMNSRALALQEADAKQAHERSQPAAQHYRMNFGIFHYNNLYQNADAPSASDNLGTANPGAANPGTSGPQSATDTDHA